MDVTPLVKEGQQIVQSYAGGVFRISGQTYSSSVIVTPEATIEINLNGDVQVLTLDDFKPLFDFVADYDVFLFGSGAQMAFLPKELKNDLRSKGIAFDVMDTGAACRTYNVLMAEGRRVTAVLLPY
ncbi:MAG: Mth938-like domain-containing protein [Pseudomonadota bacterium]